MTLAIVPHDLAPALIGEGSDWYSFVGNAASIAGLSVSLLSLYITFLVKSSVNQIEAEYVFRLQSPQWIAELNGHITRLSETFKPFDLDGARDTLTKVSSLLEAMDQQTPPDVAARGRELNAEIVAALKRRWWSEKIRLDSNRVSELYYRLVKFAADIRHSVSRAQHRPTR